MKILLLRKAQVLRSHISREQQYYDHLVNYSMNLSIFTIAIIMAYDKHKGLQ